jgi:DNA-binding NarL/FixJ family response regulator
MSSSANHEMVPIPQRRRVVVADDHPSVLTALLRTLKPHCDVVSIAIDGEDLLRRVEEARPDVVVTDISMPRMNGLDACRHIRRIFPDVRVVMVSSLFDEDLVASAFACDAHAVVRKVDMTRELPQAVLASHDARSTSPTGPRGTARPITPRRAGRSVQ